ncbi:MAG: hypothetical protein ABIP79_04730 [Chitinophagaceae bacterium]
MAEKQLTEKESLDLITSMINKAKEACHDTGIGAMMWGAVIAICSLVKLAEIHFDFQLPFDIYLLTFIAVIPQIFISIKGKKERKVKLHEDVYNNSLWLSFGICIFLLIMTINFVFNDWEPVAKEYRELAGHSSAFKFSEYVSAFFLMLYGLPTFVTGMALKFKPMLWGGLVCWVCCIVSLFTTFKIDLLLVAFAAIVAWLIPGIIMEKDYQKAKRELKTVNV